MKLYIVYGSESLLLNKFYEKNHGSYFLRIYNNKIPEQKKISLIFKLMILKKISAIYIKVLKKKLQKLFFWVLAF